MKLAHITSKRRGELIAKTYSNNLIKGSKVLDVGCGTGIVSKEISDILSVKVTGCDIDKYLLTNLSFKKMHSGNKLPFAKRIFDAAMFNDVLHHIDYEIQEELLSIAQFLYQINASLSVGVIVISV